MFPIFFAVFILATSLVAIGTGISYAAAPTEHKLVTLRLVSLSSTFACIGTLFAGSMHAFENIIDAPTQTTLPEMAQLLAGGLSETFLGPLVGVAMLAVAWLAATIGSRKLKS